MWWKTTPDLTVPLRHLQEHVEHLDESFRETKQNLSDTAREVRHLDLDMGTLEDRFKALTGRVSVAKRNDRKPEPEPEPEKDLNQMIRDGELSI